MDANAPEKSGGSVVVPWRNKFVGKMAIKGNWKILCDKLAYMFLCKRLKKRSAEIF